MRTFIAFVALFYCFVAGPSATAQGSSGITRTYAVRGTSPNGSAYSGTVIIVKSDNPDGNHYQFTWLIAGSQQPVKGIGVVAGNSVVVEWGQKYPVVYTIGSDGILRGTWENGRATEILTPMR